MAQVCIDYGDADVLVTTDVDVVLVDNKIDRLVTIPTVDKLVEATAADKLVKVISDSVFVLVTPNPTEVSEDDMVFAKRVDFVGEDVIYKGEAAVGTPENSAGWRIRKLTFNSEGDVTEQWATGNANFDKVWNDRATYAYS